MENDRSMAGWIGFAGLIILIIGGLDVFQGLIALLEDNYFVVSRSGYLAVDLTAWGWGLVIWGALLILTGLALIRGRTWARWVTLVLVTVNIFGILGFLGNTQNPIWALTVLTLNVIVIYALTARWTESKRDLDRVQIWVDTAGRRPLEHGGPPPPWPPLVTADGGSMLVVRSFLPNPHLRLEDRCRCWLIIRFST